MEEQHPARRAERLATEFGLNSDSLTTRQLLMHVDMRVDAFISAFRRAGIRQEFPAEFLEMTVEEALRRQDSTVRKLLLDREICEVSETQDTHWFSAKVRLVCLIEPTGAMRYMDSMYVFRSTDFQTAFKRALELGKNQERSYLNVDQKKVMWKLAEVLSLDMIAAESLDGVEVYSEPVELAPGEAFPFDVALHPERSQPTQTI